MIENCLRKIVPGTVVGFVALLAFSPVQAEGLTLYAVHYPPYEIEKPGSDGLRGMDVEVAIAAFARAGHQADIQFLPWKRILAQVEKGVILGALTCKITEGRSVYSRYSDIISRATRTYVASVNYKGPQPVKPEDGLGRKVVAVTGYGTQKELEKLNIPYEPAPDDESALKILLKRNYDLFYSAREFLQYVAKGLGYGQDLQYFDMPIVVEQRICFSKKWPDIETIVADFNKGLEAIRADGTYEAIHAKYR